MPSGSRYQYQEFAMPLPGPDVVPSLRQPVFPDITAPKKVLYSFLQMTLVEPIFPTPAVPQLIYPVYPDSTARKPVLITAIQAGSFFSPFIPPPAPAGATGGKDFVFAGATHTDGSASSTFVKGAG